MHPRVPREVGDVLVRPLSLFKRLWLSRDIPDGWRNANVTPTFKRSRTEGRWASPQSLGRWKSNWSRKAFPVTWRTRWSGLLNTAPSRSCLTNFIHFYNAMTGLGNEGKAGYFTKAFGFVSQEIQTLDAGVECGPNQHVQNPEWIV